MTEKTNTVKKVFSIVFLIVLLSFGIAAIVLYCQKKITSEPLQNSDKLNRFSAITFQEQYPFEEDENGANEKLNLRFLNKYLSIVNWAVSGTNSYLTVLNPLASPLKNIVGQINNLFAKRLVFNGNNTFVILPNGYLAGCCEYCYSKDAEEYIGDFSNWLNQKGISYLTLITPDKGDDQITQFPNGIEHGYTQMLKDYVTFLEDNELAYLEAKSFLLEENEDLYSWFYKSDHHWNVRAAFESARKTAEYLSEEFSLPVDVDALEKDQFELITYSDCFLGSYGKKLGNDWKEDMEVYYPIAETNFHIVIPSYGLDKSGSFEDTLIVQSNLTPSNCSYGAFLYGDQPLIQIENNNCQNGTRVLVIKYSFGDAFCPYLATTVQYLDVIDPRHFDGSIRSFIEQTNPDCVILCMGVVTEYDIDNLHLK